MKKFFKKHELFKIVGLSMIIVALLTWFIPQSNFTGTEMAVGEVTRIGLNDFFLYGLLSPYYFAVLVTFLLILGGFYELLSKTSSYQSLVNRLSKFLKGKEIAFVLITSFLYAGLASISKDIFQLFVFIPFVVTIASKIKLSKITTFLMTFGSILVGLLGATFGSYGIDGTYLVSLFNVNLTDKILIYRVIIFALAYIIINVFNIINIKKGSKNKINENVESTFEVKETKKAMWPMIVLLSVIGIFQILGYIDWVNSFKVNIFTNFHNWLMAINIKDATFVNYILGSVTAFGTWDLYNLTAILVVAMILIKLFGRIKFDECLEAIVEGAKKHSKITFMILFVYIVCIFSVMFPIVPTIVDFFTTLTKNFNVYLSSIGIFISSLFNVELRYTFQLTAEYFATLYSNNATPIIFMLQSIFGFVQFFAPTSLLLIAGLSYLDISYKTWLKYAWKIIIALFVIVMALITVVTYL